MEALAHFHYYQSFFIGTEDVSGDCISLPQQHSLMHYVHSIQLFRSPNWLCSSIMESKHIKAVKEPWWHSSRYKALMQMLRTISWLDKLAAAQHAFAEHGMMVGTTTSYTAMLQEGGQPIPRANIEANNEEDDKNGPAASPKALSSCMRGKLLFDTPIHLLTMMMFHPQHEAIQTQWRV
jgi:hypothetical protein